MTKLILFDIDGTLLWSNGAGALAMKRALTEIYGTAGILAQIYMAGMTDRAIIYQALIGHGLSESEILADWDLFAAALARHMVDKVAYRKMRPCPGALTLLNALNAHPDVLLGLVTGNLQITAPIKLRSVGIDPRLFRAGGYGSDARDRNKLPAVAARRAEILTGERFEGDSIVVIGDTPADIACGKAVGARTVAVATGVPPIEVLRAADPDALLADFADLSCAMRAILSN